MTKRYYKILSRFWFAGAAIATVLATASFIEGYFLSYTINAFMLLVCGTMTYVNLRKADEEGQ